MSRSQLLIRGSMMLVAIVGEFGLTALVMVDSSAFAGALLAHAVIVGALALTTAQSPVGGRVAARSDLFFLLATAFLGPIGACGALLTTVLSRIFMRRTLSFEIWHAALFEGTEVDPALARRRRIQLEGSHAEERSSVAPFSDVMHGGSLEQKQAVIALIAGNFRPEFAQPLLAAMNDAEPTVRVMAATASARIENQFLESSMALESMRARDLGNVERSFALARHYDDYANTGLLDVGRASDARTRALDLYRYCLKLRSADAAVLNALIRLLVRLGREREAVESFEPLLANGTAAPESFVWYIESLYRMRRFELLRQACKRFEADAAGMSRASERCRHAVGYWASNGFAP